MSEIRVDAARLAANWRAVVAELDAPRPGRVERLLRRAGVPSHLTRVIAATPALRRAWYLAIGAVVLAGLGAAQPGDEASTFTMLVLAPVIPVVGVAFAFGPHADPSYEVALATPMRGIRLVLTRTLTVLVVAIVSIGMLMVVAGDTRQVSALWLLPALGLTSATLAVMTWLSPRRAGAAVGGLWLLVMLVVNDSNAAPIAGFDAAGQAAMLGVAAAGVAVTALRRERFDRMVAA